MVIAQPITSNVSASFASLGFSQSTADYVRPASVNSEISEPLLTQTTLFGPIAPGWELVQFLSVTIEQNQDGDYLMSDDKFQIYGVGETLNQAKQDYIISLIDYYEILSQHQDAESQAWLHHLKLYLRPVMPLSNQDWFWTPEWQAAELKVEEDLATGNFETFDTIDDFIASLE